VSKYDTLAQKIVNWGHQTENIRALIILGSRARTSHPADELSDLDLLVITTNMKAFIASADWLQEFGSPLLSFTEPTFDSSYERRALFDDFLDVDFDLSEPGQFKESLKFGAVRDIFQRGYHILLDKDDWTSIITNLDPAPPQQVSSPAQISNEIQDYWFHVVWSAKKLQRGELWSAMNCLNCYLKNKLLHMIETHTILFAEGEIDMWHNGRILEKWSAPTISQRLPGSFADYDVQPLAAALQHQAALYHDLASQVAVKLNISYPHESVTTIQTWTVQTNKFEEATP
jgi:aminoglycoside 6-adenylyltransferase